jgi:hypothetical protein
MGDLLFRVFFRQIIGVLMTLPCARIQNFIA